MRSLVLLAAVAVLGCVTIADIPPVTVTGTVRDPDGLPIENATVALHMYFWAPLCCRSSGILQLTRTSPDGRYRFVPGADRDFHFPGETRSYRVIAVHQRYMGANVWPIDAPLSAPLDLTLEPKNPNWDKDWTAHDCLKLCPSIRFDECRRVAEFHFGDKTRCDEWREDFW